MRSRERASISELHGCRVRSRITTRVAELIAIAEQAGAAGDRELHHNLLWIAAARTWWASPGPETRQLIVDAADRAGPPTAADPRLVSIHAYADPHGNAAQRHRLPARRRGQRRTGATTRRATWPRPGLIIGAFDDSLTFCATAIEQRPGRRAPRRAPAPAGDAGDPRRPPPRLGHRDPRRRGGPPAGDRARPADLARHRRDGDRDDRRDRAATRRRPSARPPGPSRSRCRSARAHFVALAQSGPSARRRWRTVATPRRSGSRERLFDPPIRPTICISRAWRSATSPRRRCSPAARTAARERLAQVEAMVGRRPGRMASRSTSAMPGPCSPRTSSEAAARFEEALSADLDRWPFWRGRLLLAHGRWLRRHRRVTDSRARCARRATCFDAHRRRRLGRPRTLRAARLRRVAAGAATRGARRADRAGAADRAARGGRAVEPRDRPAPVPLAPHDQHAPVPRVPEARDHVPGRARRGARCAGLAYVREAAKCRH